MFLREQPVSTDECAPDRTSFRRESAGGLQLRLGAAPIDKSFPEEDTNELAKLKSYNKNLFRPNISLHKWWAR
jgi:hypothetical protein